MNGKTSDPSTEIDRYIAGFPRATQAMLGKLRATILAAAPEASEKISYRIPTFTLRGNLVHFAGYEHHIGFYPGSSGIVAFREELAQYKTSKGAVQFPLDAPLPLDLVRRIVEFRVAENSARRSGRRGTAAPGDSKGPGTVATTASSSRKAKAGSSRESPAGTSATAGDEPTKDNLDACRRCELWKDATQGVPGEGGPRARVMLVGEQPGNDEDLAGRPFVGPAGALLRKLVKEAGLIGALVYITNAVKHFRFEMRGKHRLHKTPLQRHVAACHAWLDAEFAEVQPEVVVALGTTALAAVLGRGTTIAEARGQELRHPSGAWVVATYHPSAVLRGPDAAARARLRTLLLEDLKRAARLAGRKA